MSAPPRGRTRVPKVAWIHLGCAKNLVDSEVLLGSLGRAGFAVTSDAADADVIVVNTCGFIAEAKEESVEAILQAAGAKREGARLVVAGCLAQRYGAELAREIPEIDAIVGLDAYEGFGERLLRLIEGEGGGAPPPAGPACAPIRADTGRLRLTPPSYAYLRISEGCEHRCTFCAIPAIRGRLRSKPIDLVIEEARELVSSGARELVLIGQDTGGYGIDIAGRPLLADLLPRLASDAGAKWIRVLYLHPSRIDPRLIDAFAETEGVVPYLDIPIQHIDDRVLRRMGRRTPAARIREILASLRARIPGIVLRTTVLVGFPGEDAGAFARLCRFVEEARFERLGAFAFSREEGTPAARMAAVPARRTALARREKILAIQAPIQAAYARSRIGREVEVLIEGPDPAARGRYLARSAAEAPEVDPLIRIASRRRIRGFARVRLEDLEGDDLSARLVG
ncbi:MAG: 30S ribosomal protein S12 methylthiotransferase RimO [Planctomycetes bacterium]|nr:30S ribosomal protein S12 methylthiotransferase RimO [Planctomycetota bacterium]